MSITVDNSSTLTNPGYNATHTISSFQCNGTDSHLIVATYNRVASELSGVTADGNTMTGRAASYNDNVCGVKAWDYTINNASFSIVASTPAFKLCAMSAIALSGIDQTTPAIGTPVASGSFGTTMTAAYTGTAGNMLLVFINCQGAQTLTASNCTEIHNFDPSDGSLGQCFAGYVVATGSSQTIGATSAAGDNWQLSIVEVVAAGEIPPVVTSVKWFNGTSWVSKPLNVIT